MKGILGACVIWGFQVLKNFQPDYNQKLSKIYHAEYFFQPSLFVTAGIPSNMYSYRRPTDWPLLFFFVSGLNLVNNEIINSLIIAHDKHLMFKS